LDAGLIALSILFLLLLALSGTFSGSETAIFSLDRLELRRFEQSSSWRKRRVARIAARPERLLGGILFGNTLANVAGSSVMLAILRQARPADREPLGLSVAVAALIILLFGEVLPKGIAVNWPARTSVALVPILDPMLRCLAPAARVLERVALGFLQSLRVTEERARSALEWRDLKLLFEDVESGHVLTAGESTIASNVFAFFETRAHEIMTPRVDLMALAADLPREAMHRQVVAARHRRLPVYRGTLDRIVGFVNAKELLLEPDAPFETLLRPVTFVPERARLTRILGEIQARHLSLVVVVNEYGGTAGILTQEDLIEEIVGEIFDEQERDEVADVEEAGAGAWRVNGLLPLLDLGDVVGVEIPPGPAETVAGWIAHLLGRPPRRGDVVTHGALSYRVLQVRRHRAHRVLVTLVEASEREPA
jgi:magnesium and cobalt exporter, CNNM family